MESLKTLISADEAIVLIANDKPLVSCHIQGTLDLYKIDNGHLSGLVLENCYVEDLVCPCSRFAKPVKLIKTQIFKNSFYGSYFPKGLLMDACIFDSYLDFEAGGHNSPGTSFIINNSMFHAFVNFFDAWFRSDVLVTNNTFKNGTNLLGNRGTPYETTFDITPIIENNSGRLDDDGDGGRPVNVIALL